jgi:hypothetical protein
LAGRWACPSAAGLARLAPDDLIALVGSGVAGTAVAGLLLYRMRATLALLRSAVTVAGSAEAEQQGTVLAAAGTGDTVAAADGPPDAVPGRPALPGPADGFIAAPAHDRDILAISHSVQDLSLTSPLYRITIAARGWDPRTADAPAAATVPGVPASAPAFARPAGRALIAEGAERCPDLVQEDTTS